MPEPKTIQEKIRELLIINQEAGTRSVFDINGISETPELEKATPLPKELLLQVFNTEKPTRDMIRDFHSDKKGTSRICSGFKGYFCTKP